MASPKTSTRNLGGFTLLEILVVMGLVLMVISFGLIFSFDDYRSTMFRNERDIIVNVMQKARSQAINNMCFGGCADGVPHGVYFGTAGVYVIFQGATYDPATTTNEIIEAKNKAALVSDMTTVVFNRLRGDATVIGSSTLTVTQAGRASSITVDPEGRIWWTN